MTAPQAARTWAGSDNSVPRLGLRKEWKHQYTRALDGQCMLCTFDSEYYSSPVQMLFLFLHILVQILGSKLQACRPVCPEIKW
jgi:hypothetical protein